MKKTILALVIAAGFAGTAEANQLIRATLPSGENVAVKLDACYDPVTKAWGPCYVRAEAKESAEALDACWDPVTKRLEPCF